MPPPTDLPDFHLFIGEPFDWTTYNVYWDELKKMDILGFAVEQWMREILMKTQLVRISTFSGNDSWLGASVGRVLEKGDTVNGDTQFLTQSFNDKVWILALSHHKPYWPVDHVMPQWTTPLATGDFTYK